MLCTVCHKVINMGYGAKNNEKCGLATQNLSTASLAQLVLRNTHLNPMFIRQAEICNTTADHPPKLNIVSPVFPALATQNDIRPSPFRQLATQSFVDLARGAVFTW